MTDPYLPAFRSNEENAVSPQFFMHEGMECVRVLIGGNSRFTPVFLANEVWVKGDYGQEITYADRWPEQYKQFKDGSAQTAGGTALEDAPFLNPSRIADLRAIKIFSIEGLAQFDERNIARLGGHGYRLKELAQEFLTKRPSAGDADLRSQIEALTARLSAAEANGTLHPTHNQIPATNDPYEGIDDAELKNRIKIITGSFPRGNPSRPTLVGMLRDLENATEAAA